MNEKACFEWVAGIINSCTNTLQLEGARRLVDFYTEKFGDIYKEEFRVLFTNKDAQLIIL